MGFRAFVLYFPPLQRNQNQQRNSSRSSRCKKRKRRKRKRLFQCKILSEYPFQGGRDTDFYWLFWWVQVKGHCFRFSCLRYQVCHSGTNFTTFSSTSFHSHLCHSNVPLGQDFCLPQMLVPTKSCHSLYIFSLQGMFPINLMVFPFSTPKLEEMTVAFSVYLPVFSKGNAVFLWK